VRWGENLNRKKEYSADDVLRKFEMLLEETTLSAYDIYDELAEEFGKKPSRIKSFWEKLWETK